MERKLERWLICGGRNYTDGSTFEFAMARICDIYGVPDFVIHGMAKGADSLADAWARERGIELIPFGADWLTKGRAAGPDRNQQMISEGKPTLVIAFPGGPGTADMSRRAVRAGIELIEILEDGTWTT